MVADSPPDTLPNTAPDRADLFEALDTIGNYFASGMRLTHVPEELLECLRSATAATAIAGEPASALGALQAKANVCSACMLSASRKTVVFGQGAPAPEVLVVGEGPGAEEDNQGLPFVGASGKLLDKMLASIGLSRNENCYIANVVKCRPPNNREPAPDERVACMPFLREQIRILKPRVILCAGRTAAQALLETTEGINKLRTRQHDFGGIPLVATYHPSALLRDESLKRPAWEDLKRLRELIALGQPANE
ncbi:MAG: uracil-DNA glycosylase [Spirochaetales bacterium]